MTVASSGTCLIVCDVADRWEVGDLGIGVLDGHDNLRVDCFTGKTEPDDEGKEKDGWMARAGGGQHAV